MHERKCWNEDLIRFILDTPSSDAVLTTPLFPCVVEDEISWRGECIGNYTVRSAYRMLETTAHCNIEYVVEGWSVLWKLRVPPKVKNFLWRLGRNCIPTRDVLIRRHLDVPSECPFCAQSDKTLLHLFAECTNAANCWIALGISAITSRVAATA